MERYGYTVETDRDDYDCEFYRAYCDVCGWSGTLWFRGAATVTSDFLHQETVNWALRSCDAEGREHVASEHMSMRASGFGS